MVKKYIPEKYDYDISELDTAINQALGEVREKIFKGRMIEIKGSLTIEQKLAIKNAVIPLLENVGNIEE